MKAVRLGQCLDGFIRSVSEAMRPGMSANHGLDQTFVARAFRCIIVFHHASCVSFALSTTQF